MSVSNDTRYAETVDRRLADRGKGVELYRRLTTPFQSIKDEPAV
jgi:hypothetical protein